MQRTPEKGGIIYTVYGGDPAAMAKSLLEAAGVAGAIPAGARVSLKPNLVVARPASGGATTHPEILAGVIEYLFDHGHREVDIIEGSWVGDDTGRAFAVCGMAELGRRYGVKLHDLKTDSSTPIDTPAGKVRVCDRALAADYLVNLPVLKGHCQTRMTCALKNMKGCIPDSEKRRFHRDGLDEWIAALSTAIRPHLNLVDGLCGDLDFEEGGNPVPAGRMLLAADPVKLDAHVCALIGIPPREIGYLTLAEQYGCGEMAVDPADLIDLNRPESAVAARPTGKAARLGRRVGEDGACSACYANLIHALRRIDENGGLDRLPPLAIGQGWRGKCMDGVGVGECARGAKDKYIAGCPPSALAIVEGLE